MTEAKTAIEPDLLEILRCPVAVHYKDKGDDPGPARALQGLLAPLRRLGLQVPDPRRDPDHASRRGSQVEGHGQGGASRARRPPMA